MTKPTFDFERVGDTFNFTFSNDEHITIAGQGSIDLTPPGISIEVDVTLTNAHDTLTLPVHDFVLPVVPPPLEDLLNI
jgi:hypothetical protein